MEHDPNESPNTQGNAVAQMIGEILSAKQVAQFLKEFLVDLSPEQRHDFGVQIASVIIDRFKNDRIGYDATQALFATFTVIINQSIEARLKESNVVKMIQEKVAARWDKAVDDVVQNQINEAVRKVKDLFYHTR